MDNWKFRSLAFLCASVPYVLVAWAYTQLVNGDLRDFWRALGVLIAVRLFFSLIETVGSVIAWRLFGKKVVVQRALAFLRANKFPRRTYQHDGFLAYLSRIEDKYAHEYPESLKVMAREWEHLLALFEEFGILLGMRMHAAMEEALEIYSPRDQAPPFSLPSTPQS